MGAGLAGLTAAMDLVDAGWQVVLLEKRPFPGGRTFSYAGGDGDILDNGQHVFLGCCSAYLSLLRRLGQHKKAYLQPHLDVRFVDDRLGPARLAAAPLPAPLHLLGSFLRLPYLSPREKRAAVAALLRIRFGELPESQSFAHWLRENGQSENSLQRLWNVIVIPTCNAPADRVSASMGGFVFRESLLRRAGGGRLGYPSVGLSEIIPNAAIRYLQERGAGLRFGVSAATVQLAAQPQILDSELRSPDPGLRTLGSRPWARDRTAVESLITTAGEPLSADAYVLAVPPPELTALLPLPWAAAAAQLAQSPIVGVNLWYDRPIFEGEVLAAIIDGEPFWLFDRTRILGQDVAEHHVAVSISAAHRAMETPRTELAERTASALTRVLPLARQAQLLRSSVNKVRHATFVPSPGSQVHRLPQRTPLTNLFLAGSWTDTGWPDTMESAIRSGHAAARLAISDGIEKRRHAWAGGPVHPSLADR